jgi:hypothetical protein
MSLEIKCENCFADFKIPHKVPVATCPYCGYTFVVDKNITEIYYFKVNFDSSKVFEKLLRFILRNFGVPKDFISNTYLTGYTLHYIPFHTVKAEAKGICEYKEGIIFRKGYKGKFIQVLDAYIPASPLPINLEILTRFKFGLRGREYFKPRITKMGKYYLVQYDKEYALNLARIKVQEELMKDIRSACAGREILEEIKTEYLGITYYPFWEIFYQYKGEKLRAIIDATNGRVLYSEYIIDPKARKFASLAAISVIIPSTIIGSIFGFGGFVIGLLVGILSSSPSFPKIFKKKIKAKEEFTEFDIRTIMLKLPKTYSKGFKFLIFR